MDYYVNELICVVIIIIFCLFQNRQGHVTKKDFSNVIKNFKLRVGDEMLKELFAVLDPENTNKISYHRFIDLFEPRESIVRFHEMRFSLWEFTKQTTHFETILFFFPGWA